jgi:hypothetical protein
VSKTVVNKILNGANFKGPVILGTSRSGGWRYEIETPPGVVEGLKPSPGIE